MRLSWKPMPIKGGTVVIGNFDGVHVGHQQLLQDAQKFGNPVIAMTFEPHPTTLFAPDKAPTHLTSLDARINLLLNNGADAVVVIDFDKEFANLTPEEFVNKVLINQLESKAVVVGTNFTYGKNAAGKAEDLKNYGFQVEVHNLQESNGVISSTRIRNLIFEGDIELANLLLGHKFTLEGIVVHGEKRGREIGYPTANLGLSGNWTIPADGIYAGWLEVENQRWPAAISIGTNPTFEGIRARQVEAYALDQEGLNLYDQSAKIIFGWRLRETIKFDGLAPLLAQMKIDCDQARELTSK
ncbi:MAG: bifunctional riboflavin kinase/FAD synthetase [Candidatus Nanopelagicaceae bacterium]